jgi:IS4 transposase
MAYAVSKDGTSVPVRICAKRKTPEQIEKAMKKLNLRKRKCGVTDEARIFNEYIVVVTSLSEETASAEQILALYRLRWQVEIYFKRLKSILDFGELPKKKPEHSLAWLNGKLMVALLIESVIASSFSPDEKHGDFDVEEYMARNEDFDFDY